ncbi:transcriptional regulator, TetR family [Roseovarius nanhaiticus]|uniref:HTH-type transcriptional regulator BetI n=1 Tax=Roseovarius nanhaiticus TaxID=573024 RepID=A0A1N7HDD9_9RHOB|nr:transcriptional regulator BetI [Roseovarius nanhaiticus]SEL01127.1 transcriptional regulator, TetR family [Roseovarius nanhaiticus]SIS22897.1 transcriptional regulator, TetR family [Roseovarius nanhaiticus]
MPKIGMEPIRRAALVSATIQEIGVQGTLDVTVAQIARRAGMSPGLAHHYFGSKEQIFTAAMRHILTLYAAQVRGALLMAQCPRTRIEAIIRASFTAMSTRPEHIAAWLNFYVQARKSPETARLLAIYHRRLKSNLHHAFAQLAPARADILARGVAAMIDGLYCRHAVAGGGDISHDAVETLMHYVALALDDETPNNAPAGETS